jgi:hypothetical protein
MDLEDFSDAEVCCPNCGSKDVSGLQVGFMWFVGNKFDFDNVIEEASQTRYFNNICCNECETDVFDEPRSYFFDLNKVCDQYEGDEQLFLLKESLKLKDWNGEDLYLIANRGFLIFSDGGLEDISTLSNRLLSEEDFFDASYYSGGDVKQDEIYKIKELNDEIILQHSE